MTSKLPLNHTYIHAHCRAQHRISVVPMTANSTLYEASDLIIVTLDNYTMRILLAATTGNCHAN